MGDDWCKTDRHEVNYQRRDTTKACGGEHELEMMYWEHGGLCSNTYGEPFFKGY
ncbi:hypothetical protein PAXRUDRAFT_830126 [Paxillus rubicundulus Ve08.2h10]|uniref:Uncharacterized protein n=1 Tax=Paxillus rubicundulus Ve08.2h10 TaxID=930991 RepID=A0A0D0D658_9AGAM|nr:hypothetical protein PAXRUDRAFT_830126 [Paxillus rubicundulus Ve08.2h10]